jgi:hypothetical protein
VLWVTLLMLGSRDRLMQFSRDVFTNLTIHGHHRARDEEMIVISSDSM